MTKRGHDILEVFTWLAILAFGLFVFTASGCATTKQAVTPAPGTQILFQGRDENLWLCSWTQPTTFTCINYTEALERMQEMP